MLSATSLCFSGSHHRHLSLEVPDSGSSSEVDLHGREFKMASCLILCKLPEMQSHIKIIGVCRRHLDFCSLQGDCANIKP